VRGDEADLLDEFLQWEADGLLVLGGDGDAKYVRSLISDAGEGHVGTAAGDVGAEVFDAEDELAAPIVRSGPEEGGGQTGENVVEGEVDFGRALAFAAAAAEALE
jgi:hypothetical protein